MKYDTIWSKGNYKQTKKWYIWELDRKGHKTALVKMFYLVKDVRKILVTEVRQDQYVDGIKIQKKLNWQLFEGFVNLYIKYYKIGFKC